MRILKVEPGKAPYAKEMEEGLKAIQREVEGIDSKRRRRLQEKRMAMGHKRNDHEDEQLHHVNDNTMR